MKNIFRKYWYILIILVCIIGIIFLSNHEDEKEVVLEEKKSFEEINLEDNNIIETKAIENCNQDLFYVDIKGEVKNPGVYEIDSTKRVIDVINMAGGLTKNADTSLINLSMKLKDEMTIKIYSKLEIENAKKSIIEEPKEVEIIKEVEKIVEVEKECLCKENDVCINDSNEEIIVNNKEAEEQNTIAQNNDVLVNINTATLEELMTINGIGESKALKIIEYRNINSFEHIEDIMNVAGIGNALFEKIKAYITV